MKVATVMITYNRPAHTKRVLEALKNNTVKPEKLFIFQNIAKDESVAEQCREVYKIIREVDWCELFFAKSKCIKLQWQNINLGGYTPKPLWNCGLEMG